MKLLQRLTVKEIIINTGVSRKTAENELKELRDEFSLKYPKWIHYLMYNKIDPRTYYDIINE